MQCLYCDRRLGLFSTAKGAFCSDEHEQLYRSAAQRRLETPYTSAAGDLAQLLKATQEESGATVQARAEIVVPMELTEAALACVRNSLASGNASASSGTGQVDLGTPSSSTAPGPDQSEPASQSDPQSDQQWALVSDASLEDPQILTERRSAPRTQEIKILHVATLRDPEKQVNCALVDISDAGLQFTSDTDFRVGEVLIAELPDQITLTEVRYSQAKDGRYAVGAERAQTISRDAASSARTGKERAGLLIEALCNRVKTGFADEPGQPTYRTKALERVARILEVWQSIQASAAPSVQESPIDAKPSTGVGRVFGAVAAALLIIGTLTVCVLQFQKVQTPLPPPPHAPSAPPIAKAESKIEPKIESKVEPKVEPKVEAKVEPKVEPKVEAKVEPKVAAKVEPKVEPARAVTPVPSVHRAQIRAIRPVWIGISTDGKKIFGGMLAKGETRDIQYSKFAFLHAGNAAGVEIVVDGKPVPLQQRPGLRLVELNATGYRFLRWSNDDPAQP